MLAHPAKCIHLSPFQTSHLTFANSSICLVCEVWDLFKSCHLSVCDPPPNTQQILLTVVPSVDIKGWYHLHPWAISPSLGWNPFYTHLQFKMGQPRKSFTPTPPPSPRIAPRTWNGKTKSPLPFWTERDVCSGIHRHCRRALLIHRSEQWSVK